MPRRIWHPTNENNVDDAKSDPKHRQRKEKTVGCGGREILRPDDSNGKNKSNHEQADARQPIQPLAIWMIYVPRPHAPPVSAQRNLRLSRHREAAKLRRISPV